MRICDITLTITPDVAVWPGDPSPTRTLLSDMEKGAGANVSCLALGAHTGTHVDAPCHFVRGAAGVEALDPSVLVGDAVVVEVGHAGHVTADDLEDARLPTGTARVLLKTENSRRGLLHRSAFEPGFAAVGPDAARWLASRGVRLVGIDYLSVEPFEGTAGRVHHTLLGAGIVVVEGCALSDVPPGEYTLVCAPLKVLGSDGAPARVFLLSRD